MKEDGTKRTTLSTTRQHITISSTKYVKLLLVSIPLPFLWIPTAAPLSPRITLTKRRTTLSMFQIAENLFHFGRRRLILCLHVGLDKGKSLVCGGVLLFLALGLGF